MEDTGTPEALTKELNDICTIIQGLSGDLFRVEFVSERNGYFNAYLHDTLKITGDYQELYYYLSAWADCIRHGNGSLRVALDMSDSKPVNSACTCEDWGENVYTGNAWVSGDTMGFEVKCNVCKNVGEENWVGV